jgi:hypothetical protein
MLGVANDRGLYMSGRLFEDRPELGGGACAGTVSEVEDCRKGAVLACTLRLRAKDVPDTTK